MPQLSRAALLVGLALSGLAAAQPQPRPQSQPQSQPQSRSPGAPAPAADAPTPPLETAEPESKALAVWYGHVESDNVARTAAAEEGSYESVGLLVGLERTSTRLEASIDADLEYRSYSLDTLDAETVGNLNAAAEVDLVQERFSWTFFDAYGQGIKDPYAGISPGNREKVNVIGTGPSVALPLGGRTNLEIRGTYSERRFDESGNVDNDSVLSELAFYRQISQTARFGIVASSNDVEYLDVLAPDYKIDRFGLRYEKELATGRVLADVGKNELSGAGRENDEPTYNFEWTRALTARSGLSIRAGRELTDSGGVLSTTLGSQGGEGASFTDVVVAPNPVQQQRFGLSYVLTMSRTVVSAEIGSWKDEYIGNPAYDNDSTALHASFVRTISPRLSFGLGFDDIDRDFTDAAGAQPDGEDSWVGAWVNRTLGRRFNLGLAISSYERGGSQSYDEQRYELRFGYSPTDSGGSAMRSIGR